MNSKKITKDTLMVLGGEIFYKFSSFIILFFLARILAVRETGIYLLAFAFAGIFILIADLGLNTLIMKEISRDKTKTIDYLSNILGIKLCSSFFALIIITILSLFLYRDSYLIIIIISISLFLDQVAGTYGSIFIANRQIRFKLFAGITTKLLLISLTLAVLFAGFGLKWVASIQLLCSIYLLSISSLIVWHRITHFKISFDFAFWRRILNKALPFLIIWILFGIYFRIDMIMISKIKTLEDVGLYGAAYKIFEATLMIGAVLLPVILPIASKLFHEKANLADFYKKIQKNVGLITPLISVIFIIFANKITLFIYGHKFIAASFVLRLLSLVIPFYISSRLIGTILISMDRERIVSAITIFGVLLNIILNLLLIPPYGMTGAAVATISSEIATFFPLRHFLHKYLS